MSSKAEVQNKLVLINNLLIERFGIPVRNVKTPDPLTTLIGTILSQNTNDNNSFRAFQALRKAYPKWNDANKASLTEVEKLIKPAGLTKQKAKAIKTVLHYAINEKQSSTLSALKHMNSDDILNELTSFDGVGVKTAACVLLFSLDRNVCPVDTHVHRTINRIGVVSGSMPEKTFHALYPILPEGIAHSFHTNLIKLGRSICTPTNPDCPNCPLKKVCKYKHKTKASTKKNSKERILLLDNLY
jgi:endonuclease-3